MNWLSIFSGALIFLSVERALPQAVRSIRSRDASGVSATNLLVAAVRHSCWFIYGIPAGLYALALSNLVLFGFTIVTIVALRGGERLAKAGAISGSLLVFFAASFALFGNAGLGWALAASVTIQVGDQVLHGHKAARLSGLSPLTWASNMAAGYGWLIYALIKGSVPVMIASASLGVLGTVVFVQRLLKGRRNLKTPPVPEPLSRA